MYMNGSPIQYMYVYGFRTVIYINCYYFHVEGIYELFVFQTSPAPPYTWVIERLLFYRQMRNAMMMSILY